MVSGQKTFGILRDSGFGYHLAGKGLVLPVKYWIWMLDLKTGSNGIGKKRKLTDIGVYNTIS